MTKALVSLASNPAGKIHGKGGYFGDFMKAAAPHVGNFIGKGIGTLLSGFGDYRSRSANGVYKPMSLGDGAGGGPGSFVGAAAPRIRHREFIGNVFSSVGFSTTTYPINPAFNGPLTLFPWLSTMADSFQQWKMLGMELYFESTCSNVSATTNTALGTVMMSTQYEQVLPPQSSSVEILNSEYTTSQKPTESFYHPIECDPKQNTISVLYTRVANAPASSFTDLGNFQMSTEGMQAAGVQIGKLWCTYDVELIKPTLPAVVNAYSRTTTTPDLGNLTSVTGVVLSAGALSNQTNFKVPPTVAIVPSTSSAAFNVNQIVFPANNTGTYAIELVTTCNDSNQASITFAIHGAFSVILSGCTFATSFVSSSITSTGTGPATPVSYFFSTAANGTPATQAIQMFCVVNVPQAGGTVTIDAPISISATNASLFDIGLLIMQIPSFPLTLQDEEAKLEERCDDLEQKFQRLYQLMEQQASALSIKTPSSPYIECKQEDSPKGSVVLPPRPSKGLGLNPFSFPQFGPR